MAPRCAWDLMTAILWRAFIMAILAAAAGAAIAPIADA
jgi:hypothetical protein